MKKLRYSILATAAVFCLACTGGNSQENLLITPEGIENVKLSDAEPRFESPYVVETEYDEMYDFEYYVVRDASGEVVVVYEPEAMIRIQDKKYRTEEGVSVGMPLDKVLDVLRENSQTPELSFDNTLHSLYIRYGGNILLTLDNDKLKGGYDRFNEWWGRSGDPALLGFEDFDDDTEISSIIVVNY